MTCHVDHCQHTATDGLICWPHTHRLAARLRASADLWDALHDATARRTRTGDPTPRAGRPAPAAPIRPGGDPAADHAPGWPAGLPVDMRASDVADAVRNTITTWCRTIADQVGADLPDTATAAMTWLAGRLVWARTQPWADELWDDVDDTLGLMWRTLDRPPQRRYLGPCACGTDLHARRGASMVTCPGCGTALDVATLVDRLDQAVRAHTFCAAEIEAACGIRADRIRQWASRGRISQRGTDRRGRALYALPEVLALAARRGRLTRSRV